MPDFVSQTGNTQVTLNVKTIQTITAASSSLGPFTVSSSTNKLDTRTRGRYANIKIENDGASQSWRFGTIYTRPTTGW